MSNETIEKLIGGINFYNQQLENINAFKEYSPKWMNHKLTIYAMCINRLSEKLVKELTR